MNKADRIIGFLVIVLGLTVIWLAQYLPPAARQGIPGPGHLPRLVAIALIICGLILFIRAMVKKSDQHITFNRGTRKRLFGVMGLTCVSAVLLTYMGFIVSCFVTCILFLCILGVRAIWATLTAAIITAAIYMTFYYGLQVQLPVGSIW